jgi:hypothetical protein
MNRFNGVRHKLVQGDDPKQFVGLSIVYNRADTNFFVGPNPASTAQELAIVMTQL